MKDARAGAGAGAGADGGGGGSGGEKYGGSFAAFAAAGKRVVSCRVCVSMCKWVGVRSTCSVCTPSFAGITKKARTELP